MRCQHYYTILICPTLGICVLKLLRILLDYIVVGQWVTYFSSLQVRLVDLCTNVFSEEDTCYHSDHAMSRCFAHAAYADIWNVKCEV